MSKERTQGKNTRKAWNGELWDCGKPSLWEFESLKCKCEAATWRSDPASTLQPLTPAALRLSPLISLKMLCSVAEHCGCDRMSAEDELMRRRHEHSYVVSIDWRSNWNRD
ncbi:hypothetical protein EYF80_024768 [Liparis tanakae]|uniref:Uncharacterized protein n=1 Tax=Liparis tanakae TaxID=230148 RepID=A0A4Z2HGM9_9TELE|nr:hypothetical protein EYF80_024768 [Liparis tanakae]